MASKEEEGHWRQLLELLVGQLFPDVPAFQRWVSNELKHLVLLLGDLPEPVVLPVHLLALPKPVVGRPSL